MMQSVYSQDTKTLWQKDLKSSTQDFLSDLSITIDEQYLVSGSVIQPPKASSVASGQSQNNGYDYHVVKLNQQGEEVWKKFYSGMNHDFLTATVSTQEGGFLLAGTSTSPKGLDKKEGLIGGSDIWLIKIAENGNEEWQKTLGTPQNDEAKAVIQSTDLGYFVAGNTSSSKEGFGSKDVWIVKLDSKGKEQSEIIIGGRGLDEVERMIPTKDGGALIGVYSRSGSFTENNTQSTERPTERSISIDHNINPNTSKNNTPQNKIKTTYISKEGDNEGEGDYWLIKLDKNGKLEWQKNYGGKGDDHIRTIANTSFGYIIGGESRSDKSGNKKSGVEEGTDVWIIAIDEKGNDLWQKSYNFGNRDILMGLNVISSPNPSKGGGIDPSKGFLLGGYTQAEGKIEKDDETFWMLYINQDGEEQWRKHVEVDSKKKEERLIDLKMGRDGSIVLAGTSAEELGKENWKIVKLGDQQIEKLIEKQDIKIYPNPVQDYCYVEIGIADASGKIEATIDLYDMSGKLQQTIKTKTRVTKINTQPLIQGAYLVTIKTNTNKTATAKIIKN